MQRDEVVTLNVPPIGISDPFSFILDYAKGKRVLNVGASGGVEHYLPENVENWLHHRLIQISAEIVGVDIDAESIAFAARHGVEILLKDCETCQFSKPFDLIVMSDVIEHVHAPFKAIANLAQQLSSEGRLLITTPNPTHYGLVIRSWLGMQTQVYYDHMSAFLPEHFQAMGNRLNLDITEVAFFSHLDRRCVANYMKTGLARLLGRFVPRCHGTFMVVLQPKIRS